MYVWICYIETHLYRANYPKLDKIYNMVVIVDTSNSTEVVSASVVLVVSTRETEYTCCTIYSIQVGFNVANSNVHVFQTEMLNIANKVGSSFHSCERS